MTHLRCHLLGELGQAETLLILGISHRKYDCYVSATAHLLSKVLSMSKHMVVFWMCMCINPNISLFSADAMQTCKYPTQLQLQASLAALVSINSTTIALSLRTKSVLWRALERGRARESEVERKRERERERGGGCECG